MSKLIAIHVIHRPDPKKEGRVEVIQPGKSFDPVDAQQEADLLAQGAARKSAKEEKAADTDPQSGGKPAGAKKDGNKSGSDNLI